MFNYRISLHGLTLIELLLAMVISLFIVAMLTTLYITTEKNQQIQSALATLTENGNVAAELIRTDIQNAGNIGCARLHNDFSFISPSTKITVTDHSLTIRAASTENAILLTDMLDTTTLVVSKKPHFKIRDKMLISDCDKVELFTIAKVESNTAEQKILPDNPLSQRFGKNARLSYFIEKTYFLENNALFMKDGVKPKLELIRGVKAMDCLYDGKSFVSVKLILTANNLEKIWYIDARTLDAS